MQLGPADTAALRESKRLPDHKPHLGPPQLRQSLFDLLRPGQAHGQDGNIGVYFRSRVGRRTALAGALLSVDLVPLMVLADEYWIDLPAMLPGWPNMLSNGLLPLLLTLAGLAAIYGGLRLVFRAGHSEGLVGLFSFILMSLVVLTIIGVFFRGPNMALVLPTQLQ